MIDPAVRIRSRSATRTAHQGLTGTEHDAANGSSRQGLMQTRITLAVATWTPQRRSKSLRAESVTTLRLWKFDSAKWPDL